MFIQDVKRDVNPLTYLISRHGGAYLSIFSVFCGWSGLSWQRLSVVNWGVLGGRVRGVYDHGPLRAAAVLAAAGLVSLPTSIPGDQDVCKDCNGYFRKTEPVFSYISNLVCVIYRKFWKFRITQNSLINQLSKRYCKRLNSISRLIVVNPSSAFEAVDLILD